MSEPQEAQSWLPLLAAHALPDDDTPGALAAGVDHYLKRLLLQPRGAALADAITGIAACLARAGVDHAGFGALCDHDRQRLVQRTLEAEPEAWRRYWRPFAGYCLEGWLCDPRRGGNLDAQGWEAVGLAGPGARFDNDAG